MNKLATVFRESRVARFLIPAGIFLIVFGLIVFGINKQNQGYVKTEATVTAVTLEEEAHKDASGNQVDATYTVAVRYTAGGRDYEGELGGLQKYDVGQKMTIYYDPSDPSRITMTISLILPLALIAAGAVACVGGVVSAANAIKRYRRMKEQEEEWTNGK